MSSVLVVLLILVLSFVPVTLAFFWIRRRGIVFPFLVTLLFLAAGVATLVMAAVIQSLITEALPEGAASFAAQFFDVFVRVALTEEGARFLVFFVLFAGIRVFSSQSILNEGFSAGGGLLAGLSFAALETAAHAASEAGVVLVRALSAAPLHGACGIRCAQSALSAEKTPLIAAGRLISAILLHACYNFMLPRGGIMAALAIFLALSSLVSSARAVTNE
ncbi:MAG: PrsW family intramembrane metalloprotease [Spirochaetaceae bacterium]|jgi:hypothetical protein|nr:PrsW family intramembrane metalloprotease [Spirochaetaceae bacterium]